jgi:uncharacterized membrane protein
MNVSEAGQRYSMSVSGLDKIELMGESVIDLPAASNKNVTVQVRVPPESGKKGSNTIYFDVKSQSDPTISVHEKAIFLIQ